ncbi:hypothetical protein [Haloferax sp. YSSS75]|uniref:hypothetical protein n=1 Tax=Haloferax sp. YSSS75 TaxID=3388564 RepID=UPI00398CC447
MPGTNFTILDTLRADIEEFSSRYYPMITETWESRDSSFGWLAPAIEWLEETVEEYGWEYLDDGGARFVVKIPPSACDAYDGPALVLKLPIYRADSRDGRYQNAWEARLWEEALDELRPYLVPVLASGDLYRWVLMPFAETAQVDSELIESRCQELVNEQGIATNEVVAAQNWGFWDGEPRLLDYGHETAQLMLDDEDHVAVEEYAPEIPASYENLDSEDVGDEEEDEVADGPVAAKVVLDGTDLLPAEKQEIRGNVDGRAAVAGELMEVEDWEINVVATEPSTGTALGEDVVVVTEDTHIRFD